LQVRHFHLEQPRDEREGYPARRTADSHEAQRLEADFSVVLRELYPIKADLYDRAKELEAQCRAGSLS
jgi:hypothetical protein